MCEVLLALVKEGVGLDWIGLNWIVGSLVDLVNGGSGRRVEEGRRRGVGKLIVVLYTFNEKRSQEGSQEMNGDPLPPRGRRGSTRGAAGKIRGE